MDKDFKELLSIFNAHNVLYLIVGGYAYARYTEPRTTKDLDLFVRPEHRNATCIYSGLADFGAYLRDVSVEDFERPSTVFQIGVAPFRIGIICNIDGLAFDEAWKTSEEALIDDEILVRYISSDNLIANKMAAGRPQDLIDVEKLRHAARVKAKTPRLGK